MSLQFYKELYAEESQRREQLQTSAGTPISIVTILGGGLLLMGKAFENSHPAVYVPFWIAFAAALCCLTVVVFCIVRSIHGYVYKRIPYASELTIHQANLQGLHASVGKPEHAQTAFEGYLIKKYVVATDFNAVNNVNRGEWLNRANRWLVYALCTMALAGVPAAIQIKTAPEKAQKIEITNLRSTSDVESQAVFSAPRARRAECSASAAGGIRAGVDSAGGPP